MEFARTLNGVVVNIEVADQEWIDANEGVDGYSFYPCSPDNRAAIGLSVDPLTGVFEKPPLVASSNADQAVFEEELGVFLAGG